MLLLCLNTIAKAQQLKPVQETDYERWYSVKVLKASAHADWYEVFKDYENRQDSLMIRARHSQKTYEIPLSSKREFYKDCYVYVKDQTVNVLHLNTGTTQTYEGFTHFEYSDDLKKLLLKPKDPLKPLTFVDLDGRHTQALTALESYTLSPNGRLLVGVQHVNEIRRVLLFDLQKLQQKPQVLTEVDTKAEELIWSPDSEKLALRTATDSLNHSKLYYYETKVRNLQVFDPGKISGFPKGQELCNGPNSQLQFIFASTGSNLYFPSKPKVRRKVVWDETVDLFRSRDAYKLLHTQYREDYLNYPLYHVWNPRTGLYRTLSDSIWSRTVLTHNQDYVIRVKRHLHEPPVKIEQDVALEFVNIQTGNVLKTVEPLEYITSNLMVSPKGNYINYFKDFNWYALDLKTGKELNLSQLIGQPLYDVDFDWTGSPEAYEIAGYSPDETLIYLYDQYDLYQVDLKTREVKRLTSGSAKKRSYRIVKQKITDPFQRNYSYDTAPVLDLSEPQFLEVKGEAYESGYALLVNGNLKEITYGNTHCYNPIIRNQQLLYLEEDQDLPPRLMVWEPKLKHPQVLFQSNPHYAEYTWGTAKLLKFENANEQPVAAALMYPFDYDPSKKYPMIVEVYEDKASEINRYCNPGVAKTTGFNSSHMRSKGYFVLYPNLKYRIDDVGVSANESLNAILDHSFQEQAIDTNRLGLIGYSFGGYETNFIVTHNNRFTAAVSGGGFNDLIRRYTSPNESGKPEFFQFENYQSRMSKPYYAMKQAYLRNSPILEVDNMDTPLLLFAGKEDYHVNWHESESFYLALSRAEKEVSLLLYPYEAHHFVKSKAREDITKRVTDWFEHYLKEKPKPVWMQTNAYAYKNKRE